MANEKKVTDELKFVDIDSVESRPGGWGKYTIMFEELLRNEGKALELDLPKYNFYSVRAQAYKFGKKHGIKIGTSINSDQSKIYIWVKTEKK